MGKHDIETEINIQATPSAVWSVLTDFKSYPSWNPFVRKVSGNLAAGSKIKISLEAPPGAKVQQFSPVIIACQRDQELRWQGHLLLPNLLFTGEHYFLLSPIDDGTRLIHGEHFSGLLVGLVGVTKFVPSFDAMNEALKKEVLRREK